MLRRSTFGKNVIPFQHNGVIPHTAFFILVRKFRFPADGAFGERQFFVASASQVGVLRYGHNLKISQIAIPAYTAHTVKAEALDSIVAIVIAAAVVAAADCIR